jgi:hypothetical protein
MDPAQKFADEVGKNRPQNAGNSDRRCQDFISRAARTLYLFAEAMATAKPSLKRRPEASFARWSQIKAWSEGRGISG